MRIIIVIITQTNGRKFLELIPVNLTALDMAAILDDLQAAAHAQKCCYGTQSTHNKMAVCCGQLD